MSIQERKTEVRESKIRLFVVLCLVLLSLYYFEYEFNNNLYNGLISFFLSVLIYTFLRSNAYYIEIGKHPTSKNEDELEHFQLFNRMHPFIAIYVKLLAIIFVISLIVSAVMIISSFFE